MGNCCTSSTATDTQSKPENRLKEEVPTPKPTAAPSEHKGEPSKPAPQPEAEDPALKKFWEEALEAHNKLRVKHKSPDLVLNVELCSVAQRWAQHMADTSNLEHSNNNELNGESVGENIANKWSSGSIDYSGPDVTEAWYSEEPDYDYSGENDAGKAGHFTQVVWKGSKKLGIGKAFDGKGGVYVCANYSPAGNYGGNFAENVGRI